MLTNVGIKTSCKNTLQDRTTWDAHIKKGHVVENWKLYFIDYDREVGLKTGAYIFRCDNNAAKKNPMRSALRIHGVLGRHEFLESLTFRIYGQKLPTNKSYIKPSAKLLGHSKNTLIFDVAQQESTEFYRIAKTDFIVSRCRRKVKNRLWKPHRK